MCSLEDWPILSHSSKCVEIYLRTLESQSSLGWKGSQRWSNSNPCAMGAPSYSSFLPASSSFSIFPLFLFLLFIFKIFLIVKKRKSGSEERHLLCPLKGSHLPVVSQASLFRAALSPPAVPGASARRQLPETTSSRARGSFQTGQKQHFSSPVHRPLSMCMWFFRDLES